MILLFSLKSIFEVKQISKFGFNLSVPESVLLIVGIIMLLQDAGSLSGSLFLYLTFFCKILFSKEVMN